MSKQQSLKLAREVCFALSDYIEANPDSRHYLWHIVFRAWKQWIFDEESKEMNDGGEGE